MTLWAYSSGNIPVQESLSKSAEINLNVKGCNISMMKIKTKGKEYRINGIEEAQASGIFIDTQTLKAENIFVEKTE